MDSLSRSLQPYKETIGNVASFLTIAQFFSGSFICLDIRKKGSTAGISPMPFVGGIMVGLATLKYAFLLEDQVMFQVNVAAIFLNVIYCAFYYFYSKNKWEELLKSLSYSMGFVAVLWAYAEFEDPASVEFRYGLIVTILMLVLLASPLKDIKDIIEKQDASQIPFVLTFMASLVTFCWLLYAIILKNNFMIIQNFIGFILCILQLALIFTYPGKAKSKKKSS